MLGTASTIQANHSRRQLKPRRGPGSQSPESLAAVKRRRGTITEASTSEAEKSPFWLQRVTLGGRHFRERNAQCQDSQAQWTGSPRGSDPESTIVPLARDETLGVRLCAARVHHRAWS